MRNCLILGCGRSGTSLAAGVLSEAGYFMGRTLLPANEENPHGYFEDHEVNSINEELLMQVVPVCRPGIIGKYFLKSRMPYGMRWLAQVSVDIGLTCPEHLVERIKTLTRFEPYCFKDPRFSYTLPQWQPFLDDAVFLCVFRHPEATARSIVAHCKKGEYPRSLLMSRDRAFQVWGRMYHHILHVHFPKGGEWVFLHYNQFLDGSAFDRLEKKLDLKAKRGFVDEKLNHHLITRDTPKRLSLLYQRLCDLAGYSPESLK